ncbi:MAG: SDR family NAD(P)-dependent oxidoreductase [Erythrobacter sp.]|nr:SDR family NAD(P)-dependent oxidoreductase [Erythrobacter sp.]
MSFTAADVPDQSGRTVMITGANTGIGFEAAQVLAGKGAQVVLACRDAARGEAGRQRIAQLHPQASTLLLQVDLADLDSVRAAAAQVERLDVLVNNAGIMRPPLWHTRQGFESQFGVNHLGHFALAALLLPKLGGADPRVVVLASIAHKRGSIDFANLDGRQGYGRSRFYNQSKLANLLFVTELDRRLRAAGSPVKAIGCHPGVAGTDLGRNSPAERLFFEKLAPLFLNSAAQGAWPTLQAATDPAAAGGDYYGSQGLFEMRGPSGPAHRSRLARDPELARHLWQVSVELTGVDPGLPPA